MNEPTYLDRIVRELAGGLEGVRRQIAEAVRPTPDVQARLRSAVQDAIGPALQEVARAAARAIDAYDSAVPANWKGLTSDEMEATFNLMQETGWSLVSTPPIDVIQQLLNSGTIDEGEQLLLQSEARITRDLREMLRTVPPDALGRVARTVPAGVADSAKPD